MDGSPLYSNPPNLFFSLSSTFFFSFAFLRTFLGVLLLSKLDSNSNRDIHRSGRIISTKQNLF